MKIVVNDTNILIDLAELGLLEEFSKLGFELHTIDLIVNELEKPAQKALRMPLQAKQHRKAAPASAH